jgi:hypothetical protein
MKTLTRKSRTALLLFLSALTLTFVFYATLPTRSLARRNEFKIEAQAEKRQLAKKLTQLPHVATTNKFVTNSQVISVYVPWTDTASPRAPPA